VIDSVVAGTFGLVGTVLGLVLSEAGASWRSSNERRRSESNAARDRLIDIAGRSLAVAEGIRWLVQVDAVKRVTGEGIDTADYATKALALSESVQRMRLSALATTARATPAIVEQVDALIRRTQKLWDAFVDARRAAIADSPDPWLAKCDEVAAAATTLVSGLDQRD
jgi:hypothetical protein